MKIENLCQLFVAHAEVYYRKPKSGRKTTESGSIRKALEVIRVIAGDQTPDKVTSITIEQCQQWLLDHTDNNRDTINGKIQRIKLMFRWAVRKRLAPAVVLSEFSAVEPLKYGRSTAPESRGVSPVSWDLVSTTISHCNPKLATMIELHWWTGMRSEELCTIAWSHIDQSTDPWLYRPWEFKTEHHGKERIVPLGANSQHLLRTYERRSSSSSDRLWQMKPGSYRQAIKRVNKKHGIQLWTPLQLRHAAGTRIRNEVGLDAARLLLGHSPGSSTTEIYAEVDMKRAMDLVARYG